MKTLRLLSPLALLLAAAPLADAHPGHAPFDFISGLVHPLTGWDHLLAMVAVGLWAAQLGGRARWALPAAFVCAMVLGAAVGISGFKPAGTETGILASVLVFGLTVAGSMRLPLGAGLGLAALAGAFHGVAHGSEMPLQAESLQYLGGMVLATAALHAAGLAAGWRNTARVRWAGAGIAVAGLVLFLG